MQINTNTVLIHGKQGGGKSMFAVLLATDYIFAKDFTKQIISSDRIFGNMHIQKDNKEIVCFLENMDLLNTLKFEKKPGIVLFDEVGLNFNSKEHGTDKNKQLTKFFFLVRKYNLSSVFISQRFSSIPVDMRELADYIFEVSIIPRSNKHPVFRITRQVLKGDGILEFYDEYIFDIISYLKQNNISYNTLEASIIN